MKKIIHFSSFLIIVVFLFSCKKEDSLSVNEELAGSQQNGIDFLNNGGTADLTGGSFGLSDNYGWTKIADFPGEGRDHAVSFAIGNNGYTGLGTVYPNFFKDFYKYNSNNNTWTQLKDFPGGARRGAVAFVLNDTAYLGLGYGGDPGSTDWLNDFWKYDAKNDEWIQLQDFPESGSESNASFIIGNKAYVVAGRRSETYQYDPKTDTWTQKSDVPFSREYAIGFSSKSIGYYGTGHDDGASFDEEFLNDFWSYDPTTDIWEQKADFPGARRSNAIGFEIETFGFVGCGNDLLNYYSDFWRYDPKKDEWTLAGDFPGGPANNLTGFVIGSRAYIGLGYSGASLLLGGKNTKSFYKFSRQ